MNFHNSKIEVSDIPPLDMNEQSFDNQEIRKQYSRTKTLGQQINAVEKEIIEEALKEHHGNKTRTARSLQISLRNLYYKMDKYDLA